MREVAFILINRVLKEQSYVNLLLPKTLSESQLSPADKALTTELVYGTLRALSSLDWIISQFSNRDLSELSLEVLNLLRLGTYQIIYLNKIPDHAACDESVKLAKKHFHQGVANFVNGVLRNIAREKEKIDWPKRDEDPVKYIAVCHSHPEWLVKMWIEDFGVEETEQLCEANNLRPQLSIRVNTLKISVDDLAKLLGSDGIKSEPGNYVKEILRFPVGREITSIPGFKEGYFIVQDESSSLVGKVVSPNAGEAVLDVCAAPGGKTTHLAQIMKNQGLVIAVDISGRRLELVEKNCRRLGTSIASLVEADVLKLDKVLKKPVDKVLLDAPCSGLGTLARRPDLRWQKSLSNIKEMADLQLKAVESSAQLVRAGGILVYSVCTISKPETTGVVEKFLNQHSDFKPGNLKAILPQNLKKDAQEGWIQLLPHKHLTDGMFIARLKKENREN